MVHGAFALAAGVVAGAIFFGGLRWTLSRLPVTRHPVLLMVSSFLIRSAVVAAVMVVAAGGGPASVLAGLAGIMVSRTVLVAVARRRLDGVEEARWT